MKSMYKREEREYKNYYFLVFHTIDFTKLRLKYLLN